MTAGGVGGGVYLKVNALVRDVLLGRGEGFEERVFGTAGPMGGLCEAGRSL